MKALLLPTALFLTGMSGVFASFPATSGKASWYGEENRGRLMANGKRFNPDKLTAASWFYPLGTKVRVTLDGPVQPTRSVLVTITDRGPARELVRSGRIIDLGHAAFREIAPPDWGLVAVTVRVVNPENPPTVNNAARRGGDQPNLTQNREAAPGANRLALTPLIFVPPLSTMRARPWANDLFATSESMGLEGGFYSVNPVPSLGSISFPLARR